MPLPTAESRSEKIRFPLDTELVGEIILVPGSFHEPGNDFVARDEALVSLRGRGTGPV